jgi:hypothetical protein
MERYIIPVAIHTFMEKKTDQISEQMMLEVEPPRDARIEQSRVSVLTCRNRPLPNKSWS